ncbi:hypothetical protein L1887_48330 [Cichorium endivia]|nr:hypothetical protein L1887_48330 [Cichorium endivia]
MFRFRSPASAASTPSANSSPSSSSFGPKASAPGLTPSSSATSALSAVDSVASSRSSTSGSTSSILSLLHAHTSASTSSPNSAAPSPSTSLASLPSEPCLTVQPLAESATPLPEPVKPAATPTTTTTSTSQRVKRLDETSPSRRPSHLASPRTSRSSVSAKSRPSSTPQRASPTSPTTRSAHRSSTVAAMAKKAKVGSAAKSSPFTKSAASTTTSTATQNAATTGAAETLKEPDSTLATVTEESSSCPTPSTSPAKPVETASTSSDSKQNVVVCVRMRPSRASASTSEAPVWKCDLDKSQIVPTEHHPAIAKRTTSSERAGAGSSMVAAPSSHDLDDDASSSTYHFQFDKLIADGQTTDDMYHSHIAPVVRAAMDGYNGTVFAYGQTGSGKTHTMSGSDTEPGVIPRAVQQVFDMIKQEPDREFLLRVSYLEIYNETLKDLLAPLPPLSGAGASLQTTDRPASPIKGGSSHAAGAAQSSTLRIIEDQKQSRVIITGLREEIVTDADTVLDLIQRGQDERHVGATDWNERSSRSHCVFQLTIESRARQTASAGKEVRISQLNLIDLAGSERAASQAERRKEGAFINKSLLTLGTVIGKLTEPTDTADAHIPYRDSKLTRILQTSLSGNARIAVICTLSPDTEHANETLSTLKFGKRCKLVVTTAKKGTAMDDKALLQKYRKELDALRARLEANGASPNPEEPAPVAAIDPALSLESQQKLDELNQQKAAAQKEVESMQKQRSDLKSQIEHLTRLILTSQTVAADTSDAVAGPSTPVRARGAGRAAPASAAADRGTPDARGRAHTAELAARDARHAELQEAIRLNEEELDEAEVAYEKLKGERDEARKIALKEQEKAREHKKKLLEEQEANRLLKLVAKARADDGDKALQSEIEALRAQLAAKEAEVSAASRKLQSELDEMRKALEAQRKAADEAQLQGRQAADSEQALRSELEAAKHSIAELEKQAASAPAASEEDDVNAEFRDLVRGQPGLDQRVAELDERERRLERLQSELDEARRALSASATSQAERELASVRDELSQSEEERRTLQVELAKARAAATGRDQDVQRLSALEAQLERANVRAKQLETELAAQKQRTAEALATVARPLPVPDASTTRAGGSVPSSPIKAFTTGASRLRNELSTAAGVGRAPCRLGQGVPPLPCRRRTCISRVALGSSGGSQRAVGQCGNV